MSKWMYHPCHKLSVPSAKLFWCRHCMQMFEDAISRWKHSRVCHAIRGYKRKNTNSKVVQMYIKPDTVSYSSNVQPGQSVYHKPQVKKSSAELKCLICDTKFNSLNDMRNHVKNPCQKLDIIGITQTINREEVSDFGIIQIDRVEGEEADPTLSNTALSVLAEASEHVESLARGGQEQVIEETPEAGELITECTGDSFTVQPIDKQGKTDCDNLARFYLGTLVLSLQGDPFVETEKFFTPDIVQACLQETASKFPKGQTLEVKLCCLSEVVKTYIVLEQGKITEIKVDSLPAVEHPGETIHPASSSLVGDTNTNTESYIIQTDNNYCLQATQLESIHTDSSCVQSVNSSVSNSKPSGSKLEQVLTVPLDTVHLLEPAKQAQTVVVPFVPELSEVAIPCERDPINRSVILETGAYTGSHTHSGNYTVVIPDNILVQNS
ncbi:uncharacterized protein LOC128230172 [Mya arenaria]|uniref:uncharacterized protein LOC128230172 n=1 Tax=Mya arenaria TaxID=6604 RepID=UPI0022E8F1CC|nr:uncharacterized protein LOC128230172 [Mya arenaria]